MSDINKELGEALDWESDIEKESEFTLLPDGKYNFEVAAMERGYFNGSDKMSACPSAKLTLRVKDPQSGSSTNIFDTLYLNSKAEWKLSQFFICIGQKKHGEKLKPKWDSVVGSTGRCEIYTNKYKDRDGNVRENNKVRAYLEPTEKPAYKKGKF